MIKSPYDALGQPRLDDDWEAVEGEFHCQYCLSYVSGATYSELHRQLKWTCSNGHENILEEYDIE